VIRNVEAKKLSLFVFDRHYWIEGGLMSNSIKDSSRPAFTIVELLVVIGIIAVLLSLLMPALTKARASARTVQCASNLHQITTAMIAYANQYHGAFPPSSIQIKQFWYQKDKLGSWLTTPLVLADNTLADGVMKCPSDRDDAIRSYAMNVYASSYVSTFVRDDLASDQPPGKLFKLGVKASSQIILLTDSWSELDEPEDGSSAPVGYAAQALLGWEGKPGERFGAGDGIGWSGGTAGRFGIRSSQIDFSRHRTSPNRSMTDPDGAANFAFADGHVSLMQSKELANFATGKSRYVALWSELDSQAEEY
jgi:prepilin-type processing-associated H-X9-DG protein/prepilin-type N-terminal cleavage/methylation domain-containing protein